MYYIRATGNNQLADGTSRWLKIRNFVKFNDGYEVAVRIRGNNKYVNVSEKYNRHLEFAKGWPGLMPVSLRTIINNYYKEN